MRVDIRTETQKGDIVSWSAHCFVNDALVGTVPLPGYTGGKVGVVSVGRPYEVGIVQFDDFLVAGLFE